MAGGTFISWAEWVALLSEVAGTDVMPIEMSVEDLIAMGRDADAAVAAGGEPVGLTEEAATIMACAVPTDDSATPCPCSERAIARCARRSSTRWRACGEAGLV